MKGTKEEADEGFTYLKLLSDSLYRMDGFEEVGRRVAHATNLIGEYVGALERSKA